MEAISALLRLRLHLLKMRLRHGTFESRVMSVEEVDPEKEPSVVTRFAKPFESVLHHDIGRLVAFPTAALNGLETLSHCGQEADTDKGSRVEALLLELARQSRDRRTQLDAIPDYPMTSRILGGEHAGVRRPRMRRTGDGSVESDTPGSHGIQKRRNRSRIAVASEVIGAQSIDGDEYEVVESRLVSSPTAEAEEEYQGDQTAADADSYCPPVLAINSPIAGCSCGG